MSYKNKIDFKYQEMLKGISEEIKSLDKELGEAKRPLLKKIGYTIKEAVQNEIDIAEYNYNRFNYDGSEPYRHIKDDISVRVKENAVIVHGGRNTAFKWHILNDGHLAGNHFIFGSHFVDKAIKKSKPQIDRLIDTELWKEKGRNG